MPAVRLRPVSVLCLVTAVVLAGCAGNAGSEEPEELEQSFDDIDLDTGSGKGVLFGTVVDAAVTPIPEAKVRISPVGLEEVADGKGRFAFTDLEPGTYFVEASKPGYSTIQSSTNVVAGATDPAPLLIMLERLPGTEPFILDLKWEGFMNCSFTVAIAFGTGCLIAEYTNDDSRDYQDIPNTPDFLQSELDWEHTQALGENLCMRHYASDGLGGDIMVDDVCGPRPLMQKVDGARLNETGVGSSQGLERVVWVDDYAADSTLGVAINQDFTVYTMLFYNLVPREGWTLIENGPYEP